MPPQPPPPADRWFRTKPQAAAELGVDPRTVNRMIVAGELETRQLGSREVVTTRSIRRIIDGETAESAS